MKNAAGEVEQPEEPAEDERLAEQSDQQQPRKRCRTTAAKKYVKKVFDVSPAEMSRRNPSSGKGIIPFKHMVSERRRANLTETKLLDDGLSEKKMT